MIVIKTEEKLVSVAVIGEFSLADYREFEDHVLHNLKFEGGVYLLMDLRDMLNYTLDVVWEEIRFANRHRYDFRRIAVVTDDQWMVWLIWLNKLFVDAEVRAFDEPGIALDWLKSIPVKTAD